MLRREHDPGQQPQETAQTHTDKQSPPAISLDQQSADQGAQKRPHFRSHIDQRIGQSATLGGEKANHDVGNGGQKYTLTHPQHQPRAKQSRETVCQAGGGHRQRPHQETNRINPFYFVAVHQPAHRQLHERVTPEEGRQQGTQPAGRQGKLLRQNRRGDRKICRGRCN